MTKLAWTPWHKVVKIRPDLKSGELSLNIFAADLYDVAMGGEARLSGRPRILLPQLSHLQSAQTGQRHCHASRRQE